ncbi:MAG: hypothetical protein KKD53_09960 [Proteobacteria bacterium]|nr:hypothetical protein [Pseudomonadota bacterium]
MFKKIFLWGVFVAAVLTLLVYYLGAAHVNYSISVNGEPIHGLQKIIFAAGGVLVAGLAAMGAFAFVALVLAGTSMVLLGVMAVFFLGLLFIFSPVLAPVVGVVIIVALIARKRQDKNTHDAQKPL